MTHQAFTFCVPRAFGSMRSSLVAYAARIADPDTAEDLVQEAFIRAIESGRPDLDDLPLAYFKTIVHNLAMDTFWKRSRDRIASARLTAEHGRGRDLAAERDTLDADIQDRLAELSPRQWESLVMTVVHGLTERQAASAADVSRSAVTGSRERALAQLRDLASGQHHTPPVIAGTSEPGKRRSGGSSIAGKRMAS